MMTKWMAWAALALMVAAGPLAAQERRLDPLDEAAKDASWASFKQALLAALDRRDRDFVLGLLDKDVRSGLYGERGVAEFTRQWQLDTEATPLWQALRTVLLLPSAYHRTEQGPLELCVPYVAVRWPQDIDAFRGGAIVVRQAPVKAAPTPTSKTLATLSHNIVEVVDWEVEDQAPGARQKWVRIRLKAGIGYVLEEQIRSPIEHAACFVKEGQSWRMTGFGPGGGR